ncbi:hypothetical protein [Streptomyces sp. DH12]|uniref:hypothetical protein n=1 Tax=Streptomyces sp. DH12 TaxID=2857010 RepID=UPI001E4D9F03|nr:hypothetical protein [Streptomyces sp. DH12]
MTNFCDVAGLRAKETQILADAGQALGAVYLAGYVVECRLKHFLHVRGIPFPRSGREGHNLRGLWETACFPKPPGHGGLFLAHWGTELRYATELPKGVDADDLLKGGRDLAGWVSTRIRDAGSKARGRSRGVGR